MTTSYQVDLLFGTTRSDSQLARLEQKLRQIDQRAAAAGGRDAFGGISRGAQKAEASIGGLVGAIGKLLPALALVGAGMAIFRETAGLETQTKSIEMLTGSLTKTKEIIAEIKAYGAVTPFTSSELIDVTKRLAAFGVETNKLVPTTKRLGDLAGATGANIGELSLAYGQVMSKGRVQTEEMLQFQERGIGVQAELQKMYKLSGAEMQEAISAGQVSAEALEVAIIRLTNTGGRYANGAMAQSDTLNGKLSTLIDGIQTLAQTIGKALEPAFKSALDMAIALTGQIQSMVSLMGDLGGQRREVEWGKQADAATERFAKQAGWGPFDGTGGANKADFHQRVLDQKRADYALAQQPKAALKAAPQVTPATPALMAGTSGLAEGRRKAARAEIDYPSYITQDQYRTWLKSQGFSRTSGDYTNRGHRTPNHMLNAVDSGWMSGSLADAQRETARMERRLRATGAFGSQLFGPISDPGGHGNGSNVHLHTPTPGGRIKMNAKLAKLMGLSKGGMGDSMADWENQSADDTAKRQEEAAQDLATRKQSLAASGAELKIRLASTPLQKIEAEYQRDILKVKQSIEGMTQDDTTKQTEKNGLLDAEISKREKIGALLVEEAKSKEAAMRGRLDNIDQLEATLKGPDAVKALDRRNAVGSMSAAGVDPAQAGGIYDREQTLDRQVERQKELNALWNEGGQVLGGLFTDLIKGTDDWQASLTRALESLANVLLQAGLKSLAGNDGVGLFSLLGGAFGGSFAGGGYTGSGSRSGGLDGQGGFPAILHPNETVVDHSKGQGVGGGVSVGGIVVNVATDGSTQVNSQGGGDLARGIQAAVTAEILRQRRPGGALARG